LTSDTVRGGAANQPSTDVDHESRLEDSPRRVPSRSSTDRPDALKRPRNLTPLEAFQQIKPPAPVLDLRAREADLATSLEMTVDPVDRVFWSFVPSTGPVSFTADLLRDLAAMQRGVRAAFVRDRSLRYLVSGSRIPDIYNLGGDLGLFTRLIMAEDRAGLHDYARSCIDVLFFNSVGLDLPLVTVTLVQGDALGGGFEAALSHDVIVAERRARFGLPEVMFNLFPGMGAYNFLRRRLGSTAAERLILSGKTFSAEEMHAIGIVDVLADDGMGEEVTADYLRRHGRRFNSHHAMIQVRRRVDPVSYDELAAVTDIWVDAALRLDSADLRKMERLRAAQSKMRALKDVAATA
jgi:DSF synthase